MVRYNDNSKYMEDNEMIGVLTYDVPHRKTYDTLCLLKARNVSGGEVVVFATPFHYEKKFKPLINHRPHCNNDITPKELCKSFNFEYYVNFSYDVLPGNSIILVCGSGIIEESVIKKYRIINSHPGYLPNVRGLDALKWAIYDGQPIGVTTHQIGEHIDAGLIIERKLVPLHFNDTFHSVAQRQYEMEVSMLVDAIDKIEAATEFIEPQNFPLRKRMSHETETRVIGRFNTIIDNVVIE